MNGKFLIRGYAPADEAALTALWKRCFGDSEELIHGFFAMLPELGAGVTAELDGKPVGMAFAICGMALSSGEKCGYIYAVAVDESCRGFGAGAALTRAAADAARGLGAEIICTLPAEASLYPWYEKLISTRFTLCRRRGIIPAGDARGFAPLSAAEYNARREALLAGAPHLTVNDACAELLRLLCEAYGGGLFAVDGGIAAGYLEEDACLIRELICPDDLREENAAALARQLGAAKAELCSPAPSGNSFVALDRSIPRDTVWNIAFD